MRIASVNVRNFDLKGDIFIALVWGEEENKLFAGEWGKGNLLKSTATQLEGLVRLGADGSLYQIGDHGVKIGYYHIPQDGKDILFPTAKEMWDFTIDKVNVIISGCELKDFLFQTTLVQQCLVMLMTGLEVYAKNRLLEMENEGKSPDIDKILNEFAKKLDVRREVEEFANNNDMSMLHGLIRIRGQGLINFQDWDQMKAAYNKAFNIKFGEIESLKNEILQKIQTCGDWRHKIIHSKMDMSILNIATIQSEDPVLSDKKFIESARNDFIEFIEKLDEETRK